MRRIAVGLLASAALVAVAWAQANNSNTWVTTGNQTVGGVVQMCPRAADNVAVPCNNAASSGAGAGGAAVPAGATPITASGSATTGTLNTTLAAAAGKFTYICGYMITATATAAAFGAGSISGVPVTMLLQVAASASPAVTQTSQTFSTCIQGSAVNTPILVSTPAEGAGGVVNVYSWGYQL